MIGFGMALKHENRKLGHFKIITLYEDENVVVETIIQFPRGEGEYSFGAVWIWNPVELYINREDKRI